MRSPNTQSSQFQVHRNTAPYFVSHFRQYVEPQTDITFTLLCFIFGTYAAPLPSSSLWTYAAPLPSSPFLSLSFVVCQNHFNSGSFHGMNRQILLMTSSTMLKSKTFKLKLQISSPIFPLLLFTLSHKPTHKLHYRSTSLSGYSAKFQCCRSR